jgi:hypothetical protein
MIFLIASFPSTPLPLLSLPPSRPVIFLSTMVPYNQSVFHEVGNEASILT